MYNKIYKIIKGGFNAFLVFFNSGHIIVLNVDL